MGRHVMDSPLTTPKARSKLGIGLHWRGIDKDLHLGYRKGKRGGTWLVRWYVGNGKYRQEPFAIADDLQPHDNIDILHFHDAVRMAGALAEHRRYEAIMEERGKPITVAGAVEAYVAKKTAEAVNAGRKPRTDIKNRLTMHVLGDAEFAARQLYTITKEDLVDWVGRLPKELKASSKERIATDFKAALNFVAKDSRHGLPGDFQTRVKNGLNVEWEDIPEARDGQALPDSQIRDILASAAEVDDREQFAGDLYRMFVLLAATGARFSQIARMRVRDVQPDLGRVMVPVSRKGKGKKQRTHVPIPVDQKTIDALLPVVLDRGAGEPLLERWYSEQLPNVDGRPNWQRVERAAWRSSSQLNSYWNLIREMTGLITADGEPIVMYALRHSSIVRMLNQRIPTRVVAALHDTSTAMIERHYSSSIVDTIDEMVAPAALALDGSSNNLHRLPKQHSSAA